MVQHNSKWDRRAKARYLKKHGLTAKDVSKKENDLAEFSDGADKAEGVQPDYSAAPDRQPSVDEDIQDDQVSHEPQKPENETLDQIEMEMPLFPEQEDQDPEERRIIAEAQAQRHTQPKRYGEHVTVTTDTSIFEKANADVARSKMNKNVRNRLARAAAAATGPGQELDSDSDFDAFMDGLNGSQSLSSGQFAEHKAPKDVDNVDTSKQDWLDQLLG